MSVSLEISYQHFPDDDNKENQSNGKLESPVKWSTQNGSDSGTYAEIGGANSNTSERNVLDPADSSEEEVPLPEATSPGRSSDGPEPRADITASLDGGKNHSFCFKHYNKYDGNVNTYLYFIWKTKINSASFVLPNARIQYDQSKPSVSRNTSLHQEINKE